MNNVFKIQLVIIIVCLLCFFMGCGPEKEEKPLKVLSLKKLLVSNYPEFKDDLNYENLERSIESSLIYFNKLPGDRMFYYGKDQYSADHIKQSMEFFLFVISKKPSIDALNEFIKKKYSVYQSAGNEENQTLFTGYYEPTFKGSLKKEKEYIYPIYSKPENLLYVDLSLFSEKYKDDSGLIAMVDKKTKKVIPYHSRENINTIKDFSKNAKPVAWLSSRIDRFFLEIQGSGRIILPNGELYGLPLL